MALLFTGRAPFAAIVRDGRQPRFECELHDAAGAQVSQSDPGNIYFDGPTMRADPATGLVDMAQSETYRYRAVLHFRLKARTTVNGPDAPVGATRGPSPLTLTPTHGGWRGWPAQRDSNPRPAA